MCGKVVYDKKGAISELNLIKRTRERHRRERRYYYCKSCNGWHLTSKP